MSELMNELRSMFSMVRALMSVTPLSFKFLEELEKGERKVTHFTGAQLVTVSRVALQVQKQIALGVSPLIRIKDGDISITAEGTALLDLLRKDVDLMGLTIESQEDLFYRLFGYVEALAGLLRPFIAGMLRELRETGTIHLAKKLVERQRKPLADRLAVYKAVKRLSAQPDPLIKIKGGHIFLTDTGLGVADFI